MHVDARVLGRRPASRAGARTLIIGAGDAGRTLARDLTSSPSLGLRPIGFLDDDPHWRIRGRLEVLGPLSVLDEVVRDFAVEVVIVAIPSLPPIQLGDLLHKAAASGARVRYLPTFHAAVQRGSRGTDLVGVSPASLLGREEVNVVRPATRATVRGRRVLVTGAGGSIGSELCRQIWSYGPAALYMLDHDESNLHRLQLELNDEALLEAEGLIVADIRDEARIRQLFESLRPEVVYHAAAHKHLPLLELHPCEGVKSNVIGTRNVIDAAVSVGTQRFVMISTDKAADPTSVLGASKRLAEMVVRSRADHGTSIGSVRFGNVLGSRGSFLHVLAHQVAMHAPVTITDPDVNRFFMTVEEAVGLVLEAGAMAEEGETFVLDMGEPVRLVSLVEAYAAQMGITDVQLKFTGLRPGEKLNEELFSAKEAPTLTAHPRISATQGEGLAEEFDALLDSLADAAARNDRHELVRHLMTLVPEYTPSDPVEATAPTWFDSLYPDDF